MDKLLNLAYQESILVEELYLDPPLKGLYLHQDGTPPLIGLSTTIEDIHEKRSILAEELGHHFTSVGRIISREFHSCSARQSISKAEYKALRWAATYLISDNDLLNAFYNCIDTPSELAEYFQVTPEIINIRLKLFEKPNMNNHSS